MKLKTTVGSYEITVEGANMEEVFDQMSEASELLCHGVKCGKTGNPDTIMRKRSSGEYTFYEFFCPESGAALALGRTKVGGFFPKTKDKAGNFLNNKGWLTYKERKEMQEGSKPVAAESEADFPTNF